MRAAAARAPHRRHASIATDAAVVVGAGLVGVCTAARLADAGLDTLCVTRHPPCSRRPSRRNATATLAEPRMAYLMSRSIDLMEDRAGDRLTRRLRLLCAQPETLKAVAECV